MMCYVVLFFSAPKKDTTVRDITMSSVTSLPGASVASQLDSSRAASVSHPDLVQLRQPTVPPQRYGESAISRLAPKAAGQNQRIGSDSAAELRAGSDSTNNQRVIEWQMRNQMANDVENSGQIQQRFESAGNTAVAVGSEQRSSYYPSKPQSQLIESGHAMSRPAANASPLPQSTSVPQTTDNVAAYRGQMAANFQQRSSSASTPLYSDDQRYSHRQLQQNMYNQPFAAPVQPQFTQTTNVRPNTPEVMRYPLPGMVPQSVQHPGSNIGSNLPDLRQQLPVTGASANYRLSVGATSPTLAVESVQRPSYYPTRPQSELIEPGHVMSRPTKNASPLLQSTSMPVITDSENRDQTPSVVQQQSSAAEISSYSTPMYSASQRYGPQQMPPSQQFASSIPPQFSQMANVRPPSSEIARQPLPGMVPGGAQQRSSNVRPELPNVRQQPAIIGTSVQYRPSGGQYGVQDMTSNMTVAPSTEVPVVSNVAARSVDMPAVRYPVPDISNQRSAVPQDMQYEMATVENRAIPAGIPFGTDHAASRPHAAPQVRYGPPTPSGVNYGMQNAVGQVPSVAPGVHYDSSGSQDRLPEAIPGGSFEAARDQSAVKFTQPSGYYESSLNTEMPYGMRSTSGSVSGVPASMRYEPSNTGDGWPLPPPPQEHYGAPSVRNEFPVQPLANMLPPSSQFSTPQLQNAGDGSKPLPPGVRVSMPNIVSSAQSLEPRLPTNDIRPKKQPPPVAAKPKFPVSTGVTGKTQGITKKDDGKQLKPEKIQQKMLEIRRLESQPYLTTSDQTKLQNLRVEVEFDKRLADMHEKREDDSDSEQHRMLPPMVRLIH